jgi:hypothetical protein
MNTILIVMIVFLAATGLALIGIKVLVLDRAWVEAPPQVAPPPVSLPPAVATYASLDDKRWLSLVEESVALFDDLDRHHAQFDPSSQELAEHVCARLQEILERCGVQSIAGDMVFDRNRHQPERADASVAAGATITATLSPGFAVERRVLRRARVRLADSARRETMP